MKTSESLIIFDGVCVLCNRWVRFLSKIDRSRVLRFAPLQGRTAHAVLTRHPELAAPAETVLLVRNFGRKNETVLLRSAAVLAILTEVGGLWRVFSCLRIVPRFLRDRLYDFIAARRRGWFGKYDACPLPTPDLRARFLP